MEILGVIVLSVIVIYIAINLARVSTELEDGTK